MLEETNLSLLIRALVRYWKWILAITILFAVLGAIGNFIIPTAYEATAIISLPHNEAISVVPASFLTMEGARNVISVLNSQGKQIKQDATALVGLVRVSSSPDGSSWSVTVRVDNPELAADLSNAWAAYVSKSINDQILSDFGKVQLAADNSQKAADALAIFVQAHRLSGSDLYNMAQIKPLVSNEGNQIQASAQGSIATREPDPQALNAAEKAELATLLRGKEVADAVYVDVMIEAGKAQLFAKSGQGGAKVIKPASVPRDTILPKSSENIGVAGLLGFIISALGVIFFELGKQAN